MQWDASNPQAGFSTNPSTWLPVPPNYKTLNVQAELADPNSQLNWFKRLVELRRSVPALRDGDITMLDKTNPSVLSWVRTLPGKPSVVSAFNLSAQPKTISLDLSGTTAKATTVKTLLTDSPSLQGVSSLKEITLPPFSTWIGSVQ